MDSWGCDSCSSNCKNVTFQFELGSADPSGSFETFFGELRSGG